MKASAKEFTNLLKVSTFTNKPETNRAKINDRQIIVTCYPNKKYPFHVRLIEGEIFKIAIFEKEEVMNLKKIWNDFVAGKSADELLLYRYTDLNH